MLNSDAVPAGTITKWEWNTAAAFKAGSFSNFRLILCHTTLSSLTDTYTNNYTGNTPVTVYNRNPVAIPVVAEFQWFGFDFDTPFEYNGRDNLVVEVWWEQDSGEVGGNTQWNFPVNGRCVFSYIVNGNAQNGYPDKGRVSYFFHYMRATITPSGAPVEPTSLGRVRAIFR